MMPVADIVDDICQQQQRQAYQASTIACNATWPPAITPQHLTNLLHNASLPPCAAALSQVGFNPDAAEVTPVWDKTAGTPMAANTILVYPQSTGWSTQKQVRGPGWRRW
jgi:hypothetical protein